MVHKHVGVKHDVEAPPLAVAAAREPQEADILLRATHLQSTNACAATVWHGPATIACGVLFPDRAGRCAGCTGPASPSLPHSATSPAPPAALALLRVASSRRRRLLLHGLQAQRELAQLGGQRRQLALNIGSLGRRRRRRRLRGSASRSGWRRHAWAQVGRMQISSWTALCNKKYSTARCLPPRLQSNNRAQPRPLTRAAAAGSRCRRAVCRALVPHSQAAQLALQRGGLSRHALNKGGQRQRGVCRRRGGHRSRAPVTGEISGHKIARTQGLAWRPTRAALLWSRMLPASWLQAQQSSTSLTSCRTRRAGPRAAAGSASGAAACRPGCGRPAAATHTHCCCCAGHGCCCGCCCTCAGWGQSIDFRGAPCWGCGTALGCRPAACPGWPHWPLRPCCCCGCTSCTAGLLKPDLEAAEAAAPATPRPAPWCSCCWRTPLQARLPRCLLPPCQRQLPQLHGRWRPPSPVLPPAP